MSGDSENKSEGRSRRAVERQHRMGCHSREKGLRGSLLKKGARQSARGTESVKAEASEFQRMGWKA